MHRTAETWMHFRFVIYIQATLYYYYPGRGGEGEGERARDNLIVTMSITMTRRLRNRRTVFISEKRLAKSLIR